MSDFMRELAKLDPTRGGHVDVPETPLPERRLSDDLEDIARRHDVARDDAPARELNTPAPVKRVTLPYGQQMSRLTDDNGDPLAHAPHLTITRIFHTDVKQFGFARTDDGEDVYIPALVVRRYDLQPGDVGTGLRGALKRREGNHEKRDQPVLQLPVKFDSRSERLQSVPGWIEEGSDGGITDADKATRYQNRNRAAREKVDYLIDRYGVTSQIGQHLIGVRRVLIGDAGT